MTYKRNMGHPYRFLTMFAATFKGDMCLIWPYARNSAGYGHFAKDKVAHLAHRYLCRVIHGDPPSEDYYAIHSCGGGHLGCCNPNHLRWGTAAQNSKDKIAHRTHLQGESLSHSKLQDDQVRDIRSSPLQNKEVAVKYGVTPSNISHIRLGKTWRHLL